MKPKTTKKKRIPMQLKQVKTRLALVVPMLAMLYYTLPVYAATAKVKTRVDSIYTLMKTIVQGAGATVLIWGVFELAAAYQQHDSSSQTQGLKKIVSGILMCCAGFIVDLLK